MFDKIFGLPVHILVVHAVVVLAPGAVASADEIIGVCTGLGRYKLPKSVGFADQLPRNAAGKVLRRELRAPFWAGRDHVI